MLYNETIDDAAALWAGEVGAIYDAATKEGGNIFLEAGFLTVAPSLAGRIEKATGLDVADYEHIIDSSSIRHILKHHGTSAEYKRGQVPITKYDFVRLVYLLLDPDTVEYAGRTKQGRDVLCYTKAISEHTVTYAEEVRTKKSRLAAVTLYKRRTKEK